MLSLPFLSISLCACVLLCIYLSVFRPFESREFSYLEHERNGFPENRQIWYLFTFFRWYSLIFEKWLTFSRLKMWPRPFVFVLRIFDLLYLSIEKKEKMLYIMYRSVFCGTFFTYTIYIYMYCEFPFHSCIFSLLDSSSSIFSISLTLFFFSFFSICFSFFLLDLSSSRGFPFLPSIRWTEEERWNDRRRKRTRFLPTKKRAVLFNPSRATETEQNEYVQKNIKRK